MNSLAVFNFNSNQVRVLIIDLDSAKMAESFGSNTFKASNIEESYVHFDEKV